MDVGARNHAQEPVLDGTSRIAVGGADRGKYEDLRTGPHAPLIRRMARRHSTAVSSGLRP